MATSTLRDDGAIPTDPPKQDIQFLDGFILVNMSSDVTSINPMGILSTVLETIDLALSQPLVEFGYFVEKCAREFRKTFGFRPDHPELRNADANHHPVLSRPTRNQAEPSHSLATVRSTFSGVDICRSVTTHNTQHITDWY